MPESGCQAKRRKVSAGQRSKVNAKGQWAYFNIHFPPNSSFRCIAFFVSPLSFGSAPFVPAGRLLTASAALIVCCGKVSAGHSEHQNLFDRTVERSHIRTDV